MSSFLKIIFTHGGGNGVFMLSALAGSAQNDGFPPSGSTRSEFRKFRIFKNHNGIINNCDRVLPIFPAERSSCRYTTNNLTALVN